MQSEVHATFPGASSAERSRLVTELDDALRGINGIQTSVLRDKSESQDAGTILSITLSAPAIVLTVKAITSWLVRNNQSGVVLTLPNGEVILNNMKSEDVAASIRALEGVLKTQQ